MFKYLISILILFVFMGCSHFTINAAMCKQIASDPQAVVPQECRNYVEEEAQKAFDKTKHKQESREDIVEFTREQGE